jgi:putative flippase GtrA
MSDDLFRKFVRFINFSFIGVSTFAVSMFITLLLTEIFGIVYYVSYAVALVFGWMFNFAMNLKLTFEAKGNISGIFERYLAVVVCIALLNWALVLLSVEHLGWHYFPAILAATLILSLLNFFIEYVWVYAKKKKKKRS